MASDLTRQLQCSVCKTVFTDPVDLPCLHTFCQTCLPDLPEPSSGHQACPDCAQPFALMDLRPNTFLRKLGRENLTKMAAAAAVIRDDAQAESAVAPVQRQRMNSNVEQCVEHEEKLQLFCETDKKLICIICRDGAAHQGHCFRPVKEAAQAYMEEVRRSLEFVCRDNDDIGYLLRFQTAEGAKIRERSCRLSAEISGHFEQMHQFLREKEAEAKRMLRDEEKRATESIQASTAVIERQLQEGKRQQEALQGALQIQQPDQLLQWWTETGRSLIEEMKSNSTNESLQASQPAEYRSKVKGLSVTQASLDLGPYESHLSFFVWKQMLQVIKPVPERLTVRDPRDQRLKVSLGGASVRQTDRQDAVHKDYNPLVCALETFQMGQHYWEVEVGEKLDWGVGVAATDPQSPHTSEGIMLFLRHGKGYCVREFKSLVQLEVRTKPRRVGVYLDCDRRRVSFYDASSMALLHTSGRPFERVLSVCLGPGPYLDGNNSAPLTVCWY